MNEINKINEKDRLQKLEVIAFDLDGVIYEGNQLISGVNETISSLQNHRYDICFITNNSVRSSREIREKLHKLGLQIDQYTIFNSIDAVIKLLRQLDKQNIKLSVIGSEPLKKEIQNSGFTIYPYTKCNFLVVGFDPEFSYQSICDGLDALRSGAKFIACNREAYFPGKDGHIQPGCGALVAAIEASANYSPDFIAGKPNTILLEMLTEYYSCSPSEILMVGDTLESDVLMANRFGVLSAWVSRGNKNYENNITPSFIINSIVGLPQILF